MEIDNANIEKFAAQSLQCPRKNKFFTGVVRSTSLSESRNCSPRKLQIQFQIEFTACVVIIEID